MKNAEHIYEVIQRYFTDSTVVVLAVLALLLLLKKAEKKHRIYAMVLGLMIFLLFNDYTYSFIVKMGEAETFYRFIWAVPVTLLSAYLLIELWTVMHNRIQKTAYLIILLLFFFLNSSFSLDQWMGLPENIYQISDEQIAAAKIIRANQRHWRAKFWDDGTLSNGMREYDGTIMLTLDTTPYMDEILNGKIINETGSNIQSMLIEYEIDSIGIKKENLFAQKLFENAGGRQMGETESSYLYRFEWRSFEKRQALLEEYYNDIIRGINEEYIAVEGIENTYQFLYLTDMNIDYEKSGLKQLNAWLQMANEYGVDAVLLGVNMLQDISEENAEALKAQLEQLEIPYLWIEDTDSTMLELDEVKICAIDNRECEISREQYDGTMILMTAQPVESIEENIDIELILSGGTGEFAKNLLNEKILQYVGMPASAGMAALITVKGQ